MHSRRSALEVHEYDGSFLGRAAHYRMTSVIGHVLSIDFPAKFQNWDTTDPSTLFDAPTLKNESNPKVLPVIKLTSRTPDTAERCLTDHFGRDYAGTCLPALAVRGQGM